MVVDIHSRYIVDVHVLTRASGLHAVEFMTEIFAGVGEDEIRDAVRTRLGAVATPKSVEFWAELPRTDNGKIVQAEVRKHFWASHERAL